MLSEIWEICENAFSNSVLVTGLVVIMMIMIESLNIESKGKFFAGLASSKVGGVLTGAILGIIPGCLGGFATVSLYTHRILSFGALVAMMIASSGDEAFVMLAAFPGDAMWVFTILFVVAIGAGLLVDLFVKKEIPPVCGQLDVHSEDTQETHPDHKRHWGGKRIVLFVLTILFLVALVVGLFEHGHSDGEVEIQGGFNLLSEEWMNVLFAVLSLAVVVELALAPDHFVEEHLWNHVVVKHLPRVFLWTLGTLLVLGTALHFFDISGWISDNTVLMILLAVAVGIIPESGPHLIFVTLYASGIVPLPVLLASCVSQDGHASLPLLAESRKGFLKAKAVNCVVALAVGFVSMIFI